MKVKHLLLRKALVFRKRRGLTDPRGCVYDNVLGAWLWGKERIPLVKSDGANRPTAGTKKEDIETGEDLKSE